MPVTLLKRGQFLGARLLISALILAQINAPVLANDLSDALNYPPVPSAAHTAANSGLMQAKIAPTINLRGVVLTGWPGTMEMPALDMDTFNPWSLLYIRGLPTYAAIDPGFRPEEALTSEGQATYNTFLSSCGSAATRAFLASKPVANTLFTSDLTPEEKRAQGPRSAIG